MERVCFHYAMLCVTNFGIVLGLCIVHMVSFIKKYILTKIWIFFCLIVKDTQDEKFEHFSKAIKNWSIIKKKSENIILSILKNAKRDVFVFLITDHAYIAFEKTRRGSPVDRRPSTAEAPPTGEIHPFSKIAVTFEPLIGF